MILNQLICCRINNFSSLLVEDFTFFNRTRDAGKITNLLAFPYQTRVSGHLIRSLASNEMLHVNVYLFIFIHFGKLINNSTRSSLVNAVLA